MNKSKQADINNPSSPYHKKLDAAWAIGFAVATSINDITTVEDLSPEFKRVYDDCIYFVHSPEEAMECVLSHKEWMKLEWKLKEMYDQYISDDFSPTQAMKWVLVYKQWMKLEWESREI